VVFPAPEGAETITSLLPVVAVIFFF